MTRLAFYFPLNIKNRILRRIVFNYCGRCSMCNRLHWSLREKSESTTFSSSQMNDNEIFSFTLITLNYYLYNKRACPQTMFKILCLWRQRCQIKRITGLPKTWGQERAENKRNARVGPTSS